ncbi:MULTISPECIES: MucBP domain-containing protein, partial [unclassified Lactococcus]|uniref:MucBP domain-containing protein n=1 Tax=unclassified Lactococcus TaxID=2643510 RepID=UPI0011C99C3C
ADATTSAGYVGHAYTTAPVKVDGYVLKETPVNATGKYSDDEQIVTYVYYKNSASVTVKHVDEAGKEIADATTSAGYVGHAYTTAPVKVDGYVLKETPVNATGKYSDDEQIVTYVYTKKAEKSIISDYSNLSSNNLPSTGDSNPSVGIISGFVFIILAGGTTILAMKKNKKN